MNSTLAATRSALVLLAVLSVSLTGCATAPTGEPTPTPVATISAESLLSAQELTVLDQQLIYPQALPAQVSSSVLTLPPGVETGWHYHDAPLYAYILAGTLTVTYETSAGLVDKTYTEGEAILEAVGTHHNGKNNGTIPVRILVVNLGAEGVANSTRVP